MSKRQEIKNNPHKDQRKLIKNKVLRKGKYFLLHIHEMMSIEEKLEACHNYDEHVRIVSVH